MRVASKNRKSSKRKTQRHGLSGNPQLRAGQLEKDRSALATRPTQGPDQLSGAQPDSFRDIAYALAGGARDVPWWHDSHESVLRKARALDWSSRLSGIEEQTCDLVGGQFYDNLQAHDEGHHQAQWLRALVEHAGTALRNAITDGSDWQPLWTLLYGVALTTPEPAAEDEQKSRLRMEFPDIKDPHEAAITELTKASILLSERSVVPPLGSPDSGARPVGVPLVARDAYGSRFLQTGVFSDMLHGNEPRELIRELYRMRRRARALAGTVPGAAEGTPVDGDEGTGDVDQFGRPGDARKAFRDWYRARHPSAPKGIVATADAIIGEWGPGHHLDERSFYACSPFRVAMTAHLIGNDYEPSYANRAIGLLSEWTQWCAQQSGIPEDLAEPAVAIARAAADALDKQDAEELADPADTTPFRHRECP